MNRSRLFHMLMMVVCILPMGLILFYFLQGGTSGFESNYFWLILLLCPLMHIFMMKHMGHGHGHNHDHNQDHSHRECHQDEIDPTKKKAENRL